jgi:hypothetical protein
VTRRSHLLAGLAAGALLAAGVSGALNPAPTSAVAAAPISTATPTTTAEPLLVAPAADITAARSAGRRADELVAERETAGVRAAAQRDRPSDRISGDAQRPRGCQQGHVTEGCGSVNGPKPSEAEQRRRIADGSVPVGGGYAPGSAEYDTCFRNPVDDVCGG